MPDRPLRVLSHLPAAITAPIGLRFPQARVQVIPEVGALPDDAEGEVLLTQAWGSPNLALAVARGVRWVHAYGTGVDAFPFHALGERPLTCSRGGSAIPISEWVLAVMLAAEKKLPEAWVREPPERWSVGLSLGGLHGRTLGLVGLGGIGQAVAERALAFGMRILAHRRSDRPSPLPGVAIATRLDAVLESADHLVVAAPATAETRALLDARALARVKSGVHLINVARGELIDQEALRAALDDGRVGLASLDVTVPEPLPAGHWLYTHPRVRLSAHTSWSGPWALERLLDPFLENLRRHLDGRPLLHRVDLARGY